jgi:pimeloyl-ACP methyl ester carboxylesterase
MSPDLGSVARIAGGSLLAAGVVAAGAALGAVTERALISRTARPNRPSDEALGTLRGDIHELELGDGTVLHVEIDECDPSISPPVTVIFCHGYSLNLDSWHYQRDALRGKARLVLYDQRSHGRSSRAEFDTHHVDQLGVDLHAVIERFAPDGPLMLVGHSMGGMTIMALADQYPDLFAERIYGIALLSTTAGGLTNVSLGLPDFVGRAVQQIAPIAAASLARRKDAVERGRRGTSDLALILTRLYSFGSLASEQAGEFVAQMIAGTPIDVLAEFLPALHDHDKRSVLPQFQNAEVLVIVGSADRLTPVAHSQDIVRYVPGADFVVIENGGHMVNIEFHEQVDELLIELLHRVQRDVVEHVA